MQSKTITSILVAFIYLCTFNSNAQTTTTKGKAQLVEFTNATAKFTVPEGKTWEIVNIFSDYFINLRHDESGYVKYDRVRIFIKSINGNTLTDISINKFGPAVYEGPSHEREQNSNLVLPENSVIEFIIASGEFSKKGDPSTSKNDNLKAYINYIETDN